MMTMNFKWNGDCGYYPLYKKPLKGDKSKEQEQEEKKDFIREEEFKV